jgi:hypothetical protein
MCSKQLWQTFAATICSIGQQPTSAAPTNFCSGYLHHNLHQPTSAAQHLRQPSAATDCGKLVQQPSTALCNTNQHLQRSPCATKLHKPSAATFAATVASKSAPTNICSSTIAATICSNHLRQTFAASICSIVQKPASAALTM